MKDCLKCKGQKNTATKTDTHPPIAHTHTPTEAPPIKSPRDSTRSQCERKIAYSAQCALWAHFKVLEQSPLSLNRCFNLGGARLGRRRFLE